MKLKNIKKLADNHSQQHEKAKRILVLHYLAKLFKIQIKVDSIPYGTSKFKPIGFSRTNGKAEFHYY